MSLKTLQAYWYLSFSWTTPRGTMAISRKLYHGTLAAWLLGAEDQEENWVLINQVELTARQYQALLEKVDG